MHRSSDAEKRACMDQYAAPTASLDLMALSSLETTPGGGSVAEAKRSRGSRRKMSRELVLAGWMALEGVAIGHAGLLAVWFQHEKAASAPAALASHWGAVMLVSVLAVIALNSVGACHLTSRCPTDYVKHAVPGGLLLMIGLFVAGAALALDRHFAVRRGHRLDGLSSQWA